jgi:hypothetical protein
LRLEELVEIADRHCLYGVFQASNRNVVR